MMGDMSATPAATKTNPAHRIALTPELGHQLAEMADAEADADTEGQVGQPGPQWRVVLDLLEVQGQQVEHGEEHAGEAQRDDVGRHPGPVAQEAQRARAGRPPSAPGPRTGRAAATPTASGHHDLRRSPGMVPAPDQPVDDGDQAAGGRAAAPRRSGVPARDGPGRPGSRRPGSDGDDGDDGHGDVDEEDPAPVEAVANDAGDDRAERAAEAGDPAEDAEGLWPAPSASGKSRATRPKAAGAAMASAAPWANRLATSIPGSTAAPLRAEATAKSVTPITNIRLRPSRSARRPPRSSRPPAISTYPSTTQASPLGRSRGRCGYAARPR